MAEKERKKDYGVCGFVFAILMMLIESQNKNHKKAYNIKHRKGEKKKSVKEFFFDVFVEKLLPS